MFTGLITEMGSVENLARQGESYHLTVKARAAENLKIGDSIAVNGACLTVVATGGGNFTADVMPETVRHTNLGGLNTGDRVNLEHTLKLGGGLDGHIVTGHVEGVGTISARKPDGIANVVTVSAAPELLRYIVERGSIAVDGVSLTVTRVTETGFSVSLIPHTSKETTLGFKGPGDKVNLETDILAKYVEKMLQGDKKCTDPLLTKAQLFENGFV